MRITLRLSGLENMIAVMRMRMGVREVGRAGEGGTPCVGGVGRGVRARL